MTFYHQLTNLSGSVDSGEKTGYLVVSWEMKEGGEEVRIHLGPRYYRHLRLVNPESCEVMYVCEEEILRWKPAFVRRKERYYLELQKELEKHGLVFREQRRDPNSSTRRSVYTSSNERGDIGRHGFYEMDYTWNDWSRTYLEICFARGSQSFCGKELVRIKAMWCRGEDAPKADAAKKSLERDCYEKADVEEFLRAFDDMEYDFYMHITGKGWKISASDKGLKLNGKDVTPPDGVKRDEFKWMMEYILDYIAAD